MKRLNKRIIAVLIFIAIIAIGNLSHAGVEIKEGTSAYTSVNISEAFDICYNLRDGTSTLGTCDLDPHMATSMDWGAIAYLAQSRYGRNASNVTDNTTGNKSGVMSLGSYAQTATIFENRNKTSGNATNYRYRLEEALADPNLSKYVDVISNTVDITSTKGRAIAETRNWYGATYSYNNANNTDYPIIIRDSLFGVNNNNNINTGQAHSSY